MICLRCKGFVPGDCCCETPVWSNDGQTPCGPPPELSATDQRLMRIRELSDEHKRMVKMNEDFACGEWDDIAFLLGVIDGLTAVVVRKARDDVLTEPKVKSLLAKLEDELYGN